jgi:Protein of unknown function (DUF2795)
MGVQVTEVKKALTGADSPATGEQVAELAHGNGAPDDLVEARRGLDDEIDGPTAS